MTAALSTATADPLSGTALEAWRCYLQSPGVIVRELNAELLAEHGITSRDYDALLYLAQAESRKLTMSTLADRTMLTRSGITRLIDGLVSQGLVERATCATDARISIARLTDTGHARLVAAGALHVAGIQRLFHAKFSESELDTLASLLGRLTSAA